METLSVNIVPDINNWLGSLLADLAGLLLVGVLLAVLAWTVGFTVSSVFNWLYRSADSEEVKS